MSKLEKAAIILAAMCAALAIFAIARVACAGGQCVSAGVPCFSSLNCVGSCVCIRTHAGLGRCIGVN